MSREGALWIGGVSSKFNFNSVKSYQIFIFHSQLEGYMDEAFLKSALQQVGEYNVISIKVMKNKFTNEPASYGFINFDNDNHALTAMHKLNGKIIPSTNPVSYLLKVFVKLWLMSIYFSACSFQTQSSKHPTRTWRKGSFNLGWWPHTRSGRFATFQILCWSIWFR